MLCVDDDEEEEEEEEGMRGGGGGELARSGVSVFPCLSTLLSSSSDSVWCETLKSFNYQQLLGIH